MRFLIAGYGSIGRRHMRNLLALGEKDIVLYRSQRSTLPTDELAGFQVETDLGAALAHQPDAVIISNPTALHLDVAIPAAQAGCSILMEKPVSHNLDRMEELKEALHLNGGKLLTGFQFRFHPTLRIAARLIAEGQIGTLVSARANWGEYLPNWHPWEDYRQSYAARPDLGGGVVLTLCHPLDYLRWLMGDVDALWAYTSHQGLQLPVEDCAEIGLRFHNCATASVHLDYVQQPGSHTLTITGSAGSLAWDNADASLRVFKAGQSGWETHLPPEGFERNWLFLEETKHFLEVVREQAEPVCTLDDGIQAQRLVLAIHQSAESGQQVRL